MGELEVLPREAAEVESKEGGGSCGAAAGSERSLACLLAATRELNASGDLRAGLGKVAEVIRAQVPYETLAILLLDDLGRELRFEYGDGFSQEVVDHWRFGLGQGVVGTAAKERRTVRLDDVDRDPRYINANKAVRSELAIPLIATDRTVGVLDVGGPTHGFFTAEHERLLGLLADHLAAAIENARLYANMREQARTLSLLHEVSRELTSILDRRQLLESVAERVRRLIDFDMFAVMLWSEQLQVLEPSLTIYRDGPKLGEIPNIPLGYGICGTAAALRQAIRVPNVHLDPRYVRCTSDLEARSELVVPLIFEDRLIGVIDLESTRYDAFSSRHQQLLSTLASSVAIALENARLYEKLRRDERRLEKDLSTAREVQKRLLPKSTPWVRGVQMAVAYEPARHLGGDFYDFLPYGEDRVAVAVGDVAGKATSAALYGSLAVGTLRELAAQTRLGPARILEEMNAKLCQIGFDSRFVALGFAVYDSRRRLLTLSNSGLPHPYLARGRGLERIAANGVPLGLLPGRAYEELEVDLEPGDAVVIVSDGIEDSLDDREEEFGSERVAGTVRRLARGSALEIAQGLLEATRLHAGSADSYDDRTVLVIKVAPEDGGAAIAAV